MAAINTATLRIDDVFCTASGAKIARICDGDGPLVLMTEEMRCPFNAGTFDNDPTATRLNLQLAVENESLLQSLRGLDTWIVGYLAQHSDRIFKRNLTREQVQLGYTSVLRQPAKEGHSPLLRAKLDTEGRYAVCCWGPEGEGVPPPDNWAGIRTQPRLRFSHLWIMGSQFGAVVRLTDAKILSERAAPAMRTCPFQ